MDPFGGVCPAKGEKIRFFLLTAGEWSVYILTAKEFAIFLKPGATMRALTV